MYVTFFGSGSRIYVGAKSWGTYVSGAASDQKAASSLLPRILRTRLRLDLVFRIGHKTSQ
jgi:hypothetical protein